MRTRIASIKGALKVDAVLDGVNVARREWLAAQQETAAARAAFGDVARTYYREDDHPAMRAAKKELERASQKEDRARENFAREKEQAEAAFVSNMKTKIVAAVPTLEEAMLLFRDALEPFESAFFDAAAKGLPTPQLLVHVPRMQQALRNMIAATNRWGR